MSKKVDLWEECNYLNIELYAIVLLNNLKIVGLQREAYAILLKYIAQNDCSMWKWMADKCDFILIEHYLIQIKEVEDGGINKIIICWNDSI